MNQDKVLKLRIAGIKDGSARARLAFFLAIFSCGTILIAIYNNYLAWNRISLTDHAGLTVWLPNKPPADPVDPPTPAGFNDAQWEKALDKARRQEVERQELIRESRKEDAREQTANQGIDLTWLGIKVSSADLDVFGAIGLFITSMYYLLCIRNVAVETESLLEASSALDPFGQQYVYFGIRQSFVLNVGFDEASVAISTGREKESSHRLTATSAPGVKLSRWLYPILTFLPVITVTINIASDWYFALTQPAPAADRSWLWSLTPEFRNQFVIMDGLALIVAIGIGILNYSAHCLQKELARSLKGLPGDK